MSAPPALSLRRELARKAIHLVSAGVPVAYALGAPRAPLVATLALGVVGALGIEGARRRSDWTRGHFDRMVGDLLRPHERTRLSGATWLVISHFALAALTPKPVAVAGMWAVSVGDAMAAIVGRAAAARRAPSDAPAVSGKTIAGSAACFAATLAGSLAIAQLPVGPSVAAAGLAAIAERWPAHLADDNLRIAAAVAGGILLWRMLLS